MALLLPFSSFALVVQPNYCYHAADRKRIEREKDKKLRDAARDTLDELEESLSQALALVSSGKEHPGIKPQANTGNCPPLPPAPCVYLLRPCSRFSWKFFVYQV